MPEYLLQLMKYKVKTEMEKGVLVIVENERVWNWLWLKKKYYAVKVGNKPGIYETWAECEIQVKGVSWCSI